MQLPTVELRILKPREIDVKTTVEVLNAAFRRHSILSRDRTSEEDIRDELHVTSRLVQAFDGGALVGTATVTPAEDADFDADVPGKRAFPGIDLHRAFYLGMAGVRPDHMGLGIGARLLSECERIALHEGRPQMLLKTVEEMGNVVYYRRFGYMTVSMRPLPAGHWGLTIATHEHAMAKAIRDETTARDRA